MNLYTFSTEDNKMLSGGAQALIGDIVMITGNDHAKTLIRHVESDLSALKDSDSVFVSTLNFEDNPRQFKEYRLAAIITELLDSTNKEALKLVLSVFEESIGWFDGFGVERERVVVESACIDSDVYLDTKSSDFKAVLSALLNTFHAKDGIVIIKDFNVACWSGFNGSQDKFIMALVELATLSGNRLILQTENLETVKSFIRVAKYKDDARTTLATMQGNTPDNCRMLREAQHEYDWASTVARALSLK